MRSELLLVSGFLLVAAATARAQILTDDQLEDVKARLAEGATQSWEIGTRAEALLEADTPTYSVLNDAVALPPPPAGQAPSSLEEVIGIARSVVATRAGNNVQGPQPLVETGTAGDPPSIGVAVLLANWTGAGAADGQDYAGAAEDQLRFLLENTPRTEDGAISHRSEQVQLWSDFVYMVPPFLAYYGVLTDNDTLIQEAYDQCRLYRQYLVDEDAGGLWKHIVLGNYNDNGHWSTGNGWAAAGMLRVLGTIQYSSYAEQFESQAGDLTDWVSEIHDAIYPHLRANGLFGNYADDSASFNDAASTAILASTVYRLALLTGIETHISDAERSREALFAPASNSSTGSPAGSALAHFTWDMWLTPVVNPDAFGEEGKESPEGQAFVVELHAAYRAWAGLDVESSDSGEPQAQGAGASSFDTPGANVAFDSPASNGAMRIEVGAALRWVGLGVGLALLWWP
ncbi:Six-hairpin glycosidase-like protein [Trametes elegans]|nr:Six-hairpin glycosidase-like protein [Trametes elegans]